MYRIITLDGTELGMTDSDSVYQNWQQRQFYAMLC